MNKYNKSFTQQYKETKIASLILIFGSLAFIISAASSEWLYIISPIILTIGSFIFIYAILYFFLYWKCANYQKNKQLIPKSFRIITSILLIFYLSLYQLDENEKKYRQYLLLKESRFYILNWIILSLLITLLNFQFIKKENYFWLIIGLSIMTGYLIIDSIIMIFIWKYQGTNSKLLKVLTILTLNYRNYRFYKEIIKLNTKEKATT